MALKTCWRLDGGSSGNYDASSRRGTVSCFARERNSVARWRKLGGFMRCKMG